MEVFSFNKNRQIHCYLIVILVVVALGFWCTLAAAHQCSHGHDHHHHHVVDSKQTLLPEEIAEEEDLRLMWAHHDHDHDHVHDDGDTNLSGLGLWIHAMGCSLLVSLASLICLILLPLIFVQGKPSKTIVDSLAIFGAGAMLGDAFLHQLPHAFGGGHDHSHDHHEDHFEQSHSHSHSLKDLSIGLSVLAGIVIFLIVEKLVRYVEAFGGASSSSLGHHHHHHHKTSNKLKDDKEAHESHQELSNNEENEQDIVIPSVNDSRIEPSKQTMKKRNTGSKASEGSGLHAEKISEGEKEFIEDKEPIIKSPSNLVFGYLNLFSDGVHNFTDGMALGSAFLLYGSVGGWSRTLFLLAHELPQEIGDFGILVRSGFSVSKALFFNFLSALVALAGTSLALMWGKDPGQSSLIEGFTAGGFIYISVAGVLAEMNNGSSPALRSTALQLISLLSGMAVALCISLVE